MRNQPARTGLGELAVPLVQLDCETVGGLLSDRHIGSAVPGEVPRRDCLRGAITSQLERGQNVEPSSTVALEQGNRLGAAIGDCQVERTATKEMGSDDRGWS